MTGSPVSTAPPRAEFFTGMRDTIPLLIGAFPFGLIFGTLAQTNHIPMWVTLAMSSVVFAGSAQFIAVGLIAAGTAWPIIVLTTFVVNLRHLLYSTTLAPFVKHLSQRWKIPLAFWLTDETFAVVINRYNRADDSPHKHWYHLGSALAMYLNWQFCTILGVTVGQMLPNAAGWGLDFAMPVTFIGMTIPYLKNKPMWAAVLVAGVVTMLAAPLPHKLGLILAAFAGIGAGLLVETIRKEEDW